MFRVGVAGKVRFGESDQSRYAAFAVEGVPDLADGLEAKIRYDLPEN
jgi:hypothetical protein